MITNNNTEQLFSLESRIALLRQQLIFHHWPKQVLSTLANKTSVLSIAPGERIVEENDPITDVYLIIEGSAEVFHEDDAKPLHQRIKIVATLSSGEAIGLSQFGLYSTIGVRTASVRANSELKLLTVRIDDLSELLKIHPELNSKLKEDTDKIIRMNFIKRAAPFRTIAYDRLYRFMNQIATTTFKANTIIFQEGDTGDYCCLIIEGKVAINRKNTTGKNIRLATLTPYAIFGEMSPLIHTKRNATARTLTPCTCLILSGDVLRTILNEETLVLGAFATLAIERSYPTHVDGIEEFPLEDKSDPNQIILKNPKTHAYYQLTAEGQFVWERFNGSNNIKTITREFYKNFNVFDPELILQLTADLSRNGFINVSGYQNIKEHEKFSFLTRVSQNVQRVLEAEHTFDGINYWLERTYRKFIYQFYKPVSLAMVFLIGCLGIIIFISLANTVFHVIPQVPHLVITLFIIDFISIIGVIAHELAHAYTTKHFGCTVNQFGIGWYWIGPIAFTNTSDMWRRPKGERIAVNLAGMICDIFTSGIIMIIAWSISTSYPLLSLYCWFYVFISYFTVIQNLCPLFEFDGYYTLTDLFGRSNLREDAIIWLVNVIPQQPLKTIFSRQYIAEMTYWLSCIAFLCVSPAIAWFIQHYILIHIFPSLQSNTLEFLFPIIAFAVAIWTIITQIRQRQRQL